MAVQLQWSLDNTVGTALSVARGIFLAANNDNVQPLAIASCEKFGNTIAMCQQTCKKIENLTAKTPEPVPIRFLKAYAGFDAADTATQLSKSQAGVQFLGLAAALITSMGAFDAASALHKLLMSSASDKTLLPTVRQLKDLLMALQPRLVHSGFLNSVLGWHMFLKPLHCILQIPRNDDFSVIKYPGIEGVDSLIAAFRKLSRIGESDVFRVRIEAHSCASWVLAFTKWCLGLPPSVYLADGTHVLEQSESKVDLVLLERIQDEPINRLRVSIQYAMRAPSDLVESQASEAWFGMISLQEYGHLSLSWCTKDLETGRRAVAQALPHAINEILNHFRNFSSRPRVRHNEVSIEILPLGLNPLPPEQFIAGTVSTFLGESVKLDLSSCSVLRIETLSAFQSHIKSLEAECKCTTCCVDTPQEFTGCLVKSFNHNFSAICLDILSASLYGSSINFMARYAYHQFPPSTNRTSCVNHIDRLLFPRGGHEPCNFPVMLLENALELAGHEYGPKNGWVMTSCNGQVIYPTLYETLSYAKDGYLTLNCMPGVLLHNGESYPRVRGSNIVNSSSKKPLLGESFKQPATKPFNALSDDTLVWHVEAGDSNITVSMGCQIHWPQIRTLPFRIFERLAISVLLECCAHEPSTPLERPDSVCRFTSPLFVQEETEDEPQKDDSVISVVAVDGSDAMRFLALASPDYLNHLVEPGRPPSPPALWTSPRVPFVLRKKACLSCCLDVCRRLGISVLVL